MERAYGELDKDGLGYFTYEDLADKLIAVGAAFSKETLVSLAEDIDTDNDRKISKVIKTTSTLACIRRETRKSMGNGLETPRPSAPSIESIWVQERGVELRV